MEKCYKAALIGCGRIGSLLEEDKLREHPCTHAGAIALCDRVELTSGCDTDTERLKEFGKKWDVKRLYTDYSELLEKEKPDIICVATWSYTHADIVLEAVKNGVQAILCEKPIALSLSDAQKMIESCKKAGIILSINHERRWDASYIKVFEMINEGMIGELRTIIGNVLTGSPSIKSLNADYSKIGGGPLLHDGTHLFDIMRFFAGDIEWVVGDIKKNKGMAVEDQATAYFMFKNGVSGFAEGGGARKYFNFEVDLQGSEGRIVIGNGLLELWRNAQSSRYGGFRDLVAEEFPVVEERKSPYLGGIKELIEVIEGKKACSSSGEDGMKALEAIMAVYESARLGGKKIFLPITLDYNPLQRMV